MKYGYYGRRKPGEQRFPEQCQRIGRGEFIEPRYLLQDDECMLPTHKAWAALAHDNFVASKLLLKPTVDPHTLFWSLAGEDNKAWWGRGSAMFRRAMLLQKSVRLNLCLATVSCILSLTTTGEGFPCVTDDIVVGRDEIDASPVLRRLEKQMKWQRMYDEGMNVVKFLWNSGLNTGGQMHTLMPELAAVFGIRARSRQSVIPAFAGVMLAHEGYALALHRLSEILIHGAGVRVSRSAAEIRAQTAYIPWCRPR